MALSRLLELPLRYKPWRPRNFRLILRDVFPSSDRTPSPPLEHLRSVIDWLCRAQDARAEKADAGGVSAGWAFGHGWLPSYPETSGYIVETFIEAARVLERTELTARAHRIVDWELSIQHEDGAFPGHHGGPGSRPVIFNTGQIMHGMLAGHLQLGRTECLDAAVRAGHWMARHQDADGCWRAFEHNNTPHTYNTRATWALLATALVSGDKKLESAAVRHLDWALTQQRSSGWFATNAFLPHQNPFTHTIAYAIRGFLECGVLLGDERYLAAATKACEALARVQRPDGWLAGTYDEEWAPRAAYSCLTGVAQMSLDWTRLAQETGRDEFRDNARRGLEFVQRHHRLDDPDPVVRGAVAGSTPIWGDYARFEFPNWAAKFFADALMMHVADIAVPPVVTRPQAAH
jgi:hypothetical protein